MKLIILCLLGLTIIGCTSYKYDYTMHERYKEFHCDY